MTNKNKQKKAIDWKRLALKSVEDGIKKAIELALIALIVGASMKLVLAAIPGVMLGAIIAKLVKIWGLKS